MARSTHFTTTTGTVAAVLINSASDLIGVSATSAEAATYYIKLWWSGNGTPGNGAPTPGTTVPSITLQVPPAGIALESLNFPLNLGGLLYYWVTKLAADSDTTALVTGGDVITLIYD